MKIRRQTFEHISCYLFLTTHTLIMTLYNIFMATTVSFVDPDATVKLLL